jgi:hypothetical protein
MLLTTTTAVTGIHDPSTSPHENVDLYDRGRRPFPGESR